MSLRPSSKHDTATNLRLQKIITGRAAFFGHPHVPTEGEGATGTLSSAEGEGQNVDAAAGASEVRTDDRPYVENYDEWKDRIPRKGRRKIERLIKRARAMLRTLKSLQDKDLPLSAKLETLRMRRELTPAELAEIKETEERRRLEDFHRDRARRGAHILIESLAHLGFCNRSTSEKGKEKITSKVRFDRIEYGPLIYRYHVDAQRLPWKVSIGDLYQDAVCTTLSASVEHPVRAKIEQLGSYVTGLWYEIEIAATLGIPNLCKFADLLPLMPESAPPLAFLVGYGENKRPYWRSLEDMPHFLGGGQTQGGKSNMMHVLLCTFIARNTPADLKMLLVDMKFNGIELDRYKGLPHLISNEVPDVESGIAGTAAEAAKVLAWVKRESEQRGKLFKNEGTQNLKAWNRKHRTRRMAEIVVAIDELSLLRMDPDHGNVTYNLIREISSTARAAGIHLVAFTQSSNKRVIDEMIKVNFPGRICFSVPDASSSVLFVGDGSAINLMPAGRARFKHGTDNFLVQTPLISPSEINEVITNAREGKTTLKLSRTIVTPEEIIDWSIESNNSSLAVSDVYAKFNTRLEKIAIEKLLKSMEGATYTIGDRSYQVLPGSGRRPRIVARVEGNGASPAGETQDKTQDTTEDEL